MAQETLEWSTVMRKVNDLIPQSVNPRTISDKQMTDLKKSLTKYNLVEIPAIDQDGTILAGHQRIKALQLLGRGDELIDVRIPNRKLTDEESRRYLLSSNALGGDWDYELLKSFDLDLLLDVGFDEIELSKFWDDDASSVDDHFNPEKELKKIKTTDIKYGDLLILGKHKLLCGDATDLLAVQAVFGDERTSMIYSDHPNDNKITKNIQWYGILTDIYYPLVPLGNLLMAIAPWFFKTKPFRQSPFSSILFNEFKGKVITKVRLEIIFTITLWIVMWNILSLQWQSVLILYACFGINWATRQYVTHAWTPRNVVEGASDLSVSKIHGAVLLNGQWDHAHHKFPFLPWTELSNPKYHTVPQYSYFKRWLSLWWGMRPNFEKAPAVIADVENFPEIIYS